MKGMSSIEIIIFIVIGIVVLVGLTFGLRDVINRLGKAECETSAEGCDDEAGFISVEDYEIKSTTDNSYFNINTKYFEIFDDKWVSFV